MKEAKIVITIFVENDETTPSLTEKLTNAGAFKKIEKTLQAIPSLVCETGSIRVNADPK